MKKTPIDNTSYYGISELTDIQSQALHRDAVILAKRIATINHELLEQYMNRLAVEYANTIEKQLEGGRRRILTYVMKTTKAADALINSLFELGPVGRKWVFNKNISLDSFLRDTEAGQWLLYLFALQETIKAEYEDTPWAGRPRRTTLRQREARLKLLIGCMHFFDKSMWDEYDKDIDKLVPEMARAIHRTVFDPKLPKNSQLFRKEWEGKRTVQK